MAKGIEIPLVANSRGFVKGLRDAEDSVEDISDALDDVYRDGDKAADKLEDSFRDASRKIQRSTDDVADSARSDFRRAEDAAEGFKDEATQNFAEVASSFDGSMESIADGVQGTFGGLATAIGGPIGLAAAGVGAVAGAALNAWITSSEEIKERTSEMFEDMLESGNAYLSASFVNDSLSEIVQDQGKVNEALEDANRLGLDHTTVLRAMAGDVEALNAVNAAAAEALAPLNAERAEQLETFNRVNSVTNQAWTETKNLADKYTELGTTIGTAAGQAALYQQAALDATDATEGTTEALNNVPTSVTTAMNLVAPDVDLAVRKMQSRANAHPIRVKATLVNQYGQVLD